MCGIAGLLPLPSSTGHALAHSAAQAAVARMVDHLHHRGPDAAACSSTGPSDRPGAVFGHTRLAIQDLSAAGHQPMAIDDGSLCITYNGEIYNFLDLRAELGAGLVWRSRSDTEVILRAYATFGRESLHRLRGMFAFAIWDTKRRELFLARDRLGIKPLYYFSGDGFFAFASEVRALLASGLIPATLDPAGLWQYLTYQTVPSPRTIVDGICALPPGSWLRVDRVGNVTTHRYWDLLEDAATAPISEDVAGTRRHLGDLLREAVTMHLISDVPVAAFLSGGIDSSVVVGLMREAGHVPRSFSVGFAEREYDETHYAREIAARFGTEHTQILLSEQDLLDQVPEAVAAMDQPTGDGVNTYIVSKAVAAAGIKVALSGLGGDELFAGYPSFARLERSARLFRAWGRAPSSVRMLAASAVRAVGRSTIRAEKVAAMLETDGSLAALYPLTRQVFSGSQRRALVDPIWAAGMDDLADPYRDLLRDAFEPGQYDVGALSHISYAEARTYMHDLLLRDTDQMSMAHSLEVRVPFLDHVLAAYVVGLPDHLKRPNGTPKRLLVESLGDLLPKHIVDRPKQGFALPFELWMRGPLRGYCALRLQRLGERGIFRPYQVQRFWDSFQAGRPDVSWSRLWTMVTLDEWLERHGS